MSDYIYRLYVNSDADRAIDLFSECFGKARAKDDWTWQYHSNPYGQSSIVCEYGQEMVGFYGVVLRPLMIQNHETMAGHVMDVMTHPEHQGKGIFTNAAKAAFASSRARGVSVFFGFPNKKALPGHRKVNWKELGTRRILMHPLTQIQHSEENERDLTSSRLSWEGLKAHAEQIDSIFRFGAARHGFVGDRRWEWLQWRYGQKPNSDYSAFACRSGKDDSLRGWTILRTRQFEGKKVGHIVDWLTGPGDDDAARFLESNALLFFVSQGCEYAQCLDNREAESTEPSDPAWRCEEERELDFILRSTDDTGGNTPQADLSQWYMSLGDCDVF